MQKIHNPFWKDVLKHYKNLYTRCEPKNQDEFTSECLFYNIKIIRDKRVVYVNEWFNEGIFSIHHLTNAEGNYLTYNEFKQKYPDVKTNVLMYGGTIEAIREFQQRVKIELTTQWIWNETKLWSYIQKGNKSVLSLMTKADALPAGFQKWNKLFDNLNWKKICYKTTKATNDT